MHRRVGEAAWVPTSKGTGPYLPHTPARTWAGPTVQNGCSFVTEFRLGPILPDRSKANEFCEHVFSLPWEDGLMDPRQFQKQVQKHQRQEAQPHTPRNSSRCLSSSPLLLLAECSARNLVCTDLHFTPTFCFPFKIFPIKSRPQVLWKNTYTRTTLPCRHVPGQF